MTRKEAIALLKTGCEMPDIPHTNEMLDEACAMACRALAKKPHICVVLGVVEEQEFLWHGYTLKVTGEYAQVCKKMTWGWSGLEGPAVCDLINSVEDIMRYPPPAQPANDPLNLEGLSGTDVEQVVRCANCKHLYFKDFLGFCPHMSGPCSPDGFCNHGDRRKPEEPS